MRQNNDYFDIQADMGITKHMGGRVATRELVKLAHLKKGDLILEVGCGVGRTACFLAKEYGLRVKSIDISARMVATARKRAKRMGLEEQIDFIIANAQSLPFADESFDGVISESVTAFIFDQAKAFDEYKRVLKKDAYLAINEVTWKQQPEQGMIDYIRRIMGGPTFHDEKGWQSLFEAAGFVEISTQVRDIKMGEQLIGELQQFSLGEYLKSFLRFITQIFINPKYWRFAKQVFSSPRYLFSFIGKTQQGMYSGKK